MTIPEEMIMKHLDMLLTSSEPGATMHHLHVITAPADAIGPFGLPAEDKLHATVYAIAYFRGPEVTDTPEQFVAKVVLAAGVDAVKHHRTPLFAALNHEVWSVAPDGDQQLARKLGRQGRLQEHPDVAELTLVYAACRDGRRWRSRRWLTGPTAGAVEDVELLVGAPALGEGFGMPAEGLVRKLVGL